MLLHPTTMMRLTRGVYLMSTVSALVIVITGTLGQKGDQILGGVAMYVSFLRLSREEIYNLHVRPPSQVILRVVRIVYHLRLPILFGNFQRF